MGQEEGAPRRPRPGPIWTFLKEMRHPETLGQLLRIGARYLGWIVGRD
jgi:hypothetical protein